LFFLYNNIYLKKKKNRDKMKKSSILLFTITICLALHSITASFDFRKDHRQKGKSIGPCSKKDLCLELLGLKATPPKPYFALNNCSSKSTLFTQSANNLHFGARPTQCLSHSRGLIPANTGTVYCLKLTLAANQVDFNLVGSQGRMNLITSSHMMSGGRVEHNHSIMFLESSNVYDSMCWQFR
jgi:hypothetical protein